MEMEILKKVTKMLQNEGYRVCYIALYGSQNYSLAYEKSDYDYKALVVPSLDDIIYNKKPVSTTITHEWNGQVDVKDVRLMIDQWKKGAPNFMELLFTQWYDIPCSLFADFFMQLREKREDIAKANPQSTIKSMYGMMNEKFHALDHKYPSQAEEIENKKYAAKQLSHLIRIGAMLQEYERLNYALLTNPFTDNSNDTQFLRSVFTYARTIKTREIEFETLEEAKALGQRWLDGCRFLVDKNKKEPNKEIFDLLDTVKGEILKAAFREELIKEINQ